MIADFVAMLARGETFHPPRQRRAEKSVAPAKRK